MRRILVAAALAALLVIAMAGAAFAGEVTGNGKLLHLDDGTLHGRSACAYSGQEDLQFFVTDEDQVAKDTPTKGDPAHAQSWGQIPKADRDFLTSIGLNPGMACNPTIGEPTE